MARAVANSPLVKTALFGGDPNWGRVAQAVGAALPGTRAAARSTSRSRASRSSRAAARRVGYDARALAARGRRATRSVRDRRCPARAREAELFFSDLSYDYVKINAEYTIVSVLMRDVATLLEALPYIREFHGSTVVIKYGGAAMDDPQLREEFARDVVLLKYVGMNPVVVHGGGPDITAYMKRLDMPVEFVGGLRVSDEATVEIAKMVLVGKLNTDIVLRIGRHGQPAVGLSGDDGGAAALLAAQRARRRGHRLRRPDRRTSTPA